MKGIHIEHADTGYGKKKVLEDLNTDFHPGELTVVIGKNGCGKSTLLKSCLGFIDLQKGKILLNGKSIKSYSSIERAKEISYFSQSQQNSEILVKSLVMHGRFCHMGYPRRYSKKDYEIAEKCMKDTGCYEYRDKLTSELSGGQKQKAYLAMMMAQESPILFFDEPTTYLDMESQVSLLNFCRKSADEGKCVVAILHDLTQALKYAKRILLIDEGRIQFDGNANDLLKSGLIQKVFHVDIRKVQVDGETAYVCL